MQRYQKKPIIVNAIQWDGTEESTKEILEFCKDAASQIRSLSDRKNGRPGIIEIETLSGAMIAYVGDYIVKENDGECYLLKPEAFGRYYEKIEEDAGYMPI